MQRVVELVKNDALEAAVARDLDGSADSINRSWIECRRACKLFCHYATVLASLEEERPEVSVNVEALLKIGQAQTVNLMQDCLIYLGRFLGDPLEIANSSAWRQFRDFRVKVSHIDFGGVPCFAFLPGGYSPYAPDPRILTVEPLEPNTATVGVSYILNTPALYEQWKGEVLEVLRRWID